MFTSLVGFVVVDVGIVEKFDVNYVVVIVENIDVNYVVVIVAGA